MKKYKTYIGENKNSCDFTQIYIQAKETCSTVLSEDTFLREKLNIDRNFINTLLFFAAILCAVLKYPGPEISVCATLYYTICTIFYFKFDCYKNLRATQ